MRNCNIKIVTESEGQQSCFQTTGKLDVQLRGSIAYYKQQDSFVTLRFDETRLCMDRKGEMNLSASFQVGVRSALKTVVCSAEGEIPLYTDVYTFAKTMFGYEIELGYRLLYPDSEQEFRLRIEITNAEEGK